jgi:hypothetical protein
VSLTFKNLLYLSGFKLRLYTDRDLKSDEFLKLYDRKGFVDNFFSLIRPGIFVASFVLMNSVCWANARLEADKQLYFIRCTQCHPIEMARGESSILPTEAMALIIRMEELPESLMQPTERQRLYDYHMLDIYTNQRGLLKARLVELSPEERKKESLLLKKALAPYK